MNYLNKYTVIITLLILNVFRVSTAEAHLMVAQHGSLNVVDDNAYMVLSLPLSAFVGVDENQDGKVTMVEFNNHRSLITQTIQKQVHLKDPSGNLPIQGLRLSPVTHHSGVNDPISQLVVMGQFSLKKNLNSNLSFYLGLFGTHENEKAFEMTYTRAATRDKRVFELNDKAKEITVSFYSKNGVFSIN
jgi:hypothetical protein